MLIAALTFALGSSALHASIATTARPSALRSRIAGTATVPLSNPHQLAVDAAGNIYVANSGNNDVVVYNASFVQQPARTIANLSGPQGVAIDPYGNVFAGNTNAGQVVEFNAAGNVETVFSTGLSKPTQIAVDALDDLYVVNNAAASLSVFARSGALTQSYRVGQPSGSLTAVALDGPYLITGQSNALFNNEPESIVQTWDADSMVTGSVVQHQNTFLLRNSYAASLATDTAGGIWAADSVNDVILHGPNASDLTNFRTLNFVPGGIAVDSGRMRVYISDVSGNAIHVYAFSGQHLATFH